MSESDDLGSFPASLDVGQAASTETASILISPAGQVVHKINGCLLVLDVVHAGSQQQLGKPLDGTAPHCRCDGSQDRLLHAGSRGLPLRGRAHAQAEPEEVAAAVQAAQQKSPDGLGNGELEGSGYQVASSPGTSPIPESSSVHDGLKQQPAAVPVAAKRGATRTL